MHIDFTAFATTKSFKIEYIMACTVKPCTSILCDEVALLNSTLTASENDKYIPIYDFLYTKFEISPTNRETSALVEFVLNASCHLRCRNNFYTSRNHAQTSKYKSDLQFPCSQYIISLLHMISNKPVFRNYSRLFDMTPFGVAPFLAISRLSHVNAFGVTQLFAFT